MLPRHVPPPQTSMVVVTSSIVSIIGSRSSAAPAAVVVALAVEKDHSKSMVPFCQKRTAREYVGSQDAPTALNDTALVRFHVVTSCGVPASAEIVACVGTYRGGQCQT
jgi:hypothetical protein